jgi:hypothetical protein
MARMRRDRDVRGLVFEPLWEWMLAGQPESTETRNFGGYHWWLVYMHTNHWHPCFSCQESTPERVERLLKIALAEGTVGLSDDERVSLDDDAVKAVIAALDQIEAPPSWEWWSAHYTLCPTREQALAESRRTLEEKLKLCPMPKR